METLLCLFAHCQTCYCMFLSNIWWFVCLQFVIILNPSYVLKKLLWENPLILNVFQCPLNLYILYQLQWISSIWWRHGVSVLVSSSHFEIAAFIVLDSTVPVFVFTVWFENQGFINFETPSLYNTGTAVVNGMHSSPSVFEEVIKG